MQEFCSIEGIFEAAIKSQFKDDNFFNAKLYIKLCEIVPISIKDSIKKIFVKEHKLFVLVDSAVSKHSLSLSKRAILSALNSFQSDQHLSDIVFL